MATMYTHSPTATASCWAECISAAPGRWWRIPMAMYSKLLSRHLIRLRLARDLLEEQPDQPEALRRLESASRSLRAFRGALDDEAGER